MTGPVLTFYVRQSESMGVDARGECTLDSKFPDVLLRTYNALVVLSIWTVTGL